MISATEAWQIATPVMEENYQQTVQAVENAIKKAAKKGKINAYFGVDTSLVYIEQIERLVEELKDTGYRACHSGGIIEIYWDKEEKK